jgi:hypothetical protein
VVLSEDLGTFVVAARKMDDGLRVVFAGAEAVSGPGEIVRLYPGVGPDKASLVRAQLNDGYIAAQYNVESISGEPQTYALHANIPNPFNPTTQIRFDLPVESYVELAVYDMLGQKVRILVSSMQKAGSNHVEWDGRNTAGSLVGSGMYLYRIQAGSFVYSQRMLLLK